MNTKRIIITAIGLPVAVALVAQSYVRNEEPPPVHVLSVAGTTATGTTANVMTTDGTERAIEMPIRIYETKQEDDGRIRWLAHV